MTLYIPKAVFEDPPLTPKSGKEGRGQGGEGARRGARPTPDPIESGWEGEEREGIETRPKAGRRERSENRSL